MHNDNRGENARPTISKYTPNWIAAAIRPQRPSGLLSQQHLQRLVAAMVD